MSAGHTKGGLVITTLMATSDIVRHLRALVAAGRIEAAWAEAMAILRKQPPDELLLLAVAEIAIRREGPAAALPWLRRTAAVVPASVDVLVGVYSRTNSVGGQRASTPWLWRIDAALSAENNEAIRRGLPDQFLRAAVDEPGRSVRLRTRLLRGRPLATSVDSFIRVAPPGSGKRDVPTCISLMYRFHNLIDGPPPFPGTRSVHRSLLDSGMFTVIECPVDEIFTHTGQLARDYLEPLARRYKAGLVVFSVPGERALQDLAPSPEVIAVLRRTLGIQAVLMAFDFAYAHVRQTHVGHSRAVDLVASIDLPQPLVDKRLTDDRVLGLWTVPDPELFYDDEGSRDVVVSFVGARKAHPERLAILSALDAAGIAPYVTGGKGEAAIDDASYASLLRRSLMTLNIPSKWTGAPEDTPRQLKGRVMEAIASGALLLDHEDSPIAALFEPMKHYVSYGSIEDLVAKIRYFADRPREAGAIARAGTAYLREHYDAAAFWRRVQEALDRRRVGAV